MKKLIGVSLIALFAVAGNNSTTAQVYTSGGTTTIVKTKSDGSRKVKVVPNPPSVVYPANYRHVEMYHQAPYHGYRKVKYHDEYGRSHKAYYRDPYHYHHYHGHYDHYH